MRPSRQNLILAISSALFGLGCFGLIVWLVVWAADKPNDTFRLIVVGVVASAASPLGFALLQATPKQLRLSRSSDVRQELEAKRRLERELSHLERTRTEADKMEATRAQIEAYVELRTRELDLDRRIASWRAEAARLHADLADLLDRGQRLDHDMATLVTPEAKEVLDAIVEPPLSPWENALRILEMSMPRFFVWPVSLAIAILYEFRSPPKASRRVP